ncbi:MAG: hypothetical protein P3B98_04795 [Gemmatimonadota bacterium]|nr:hypothetical protein [Gemmatimonadota bacterium]
MRHPVCLAIAAALAVVVPPASTEAQGLFKKQDPLEITITTALAKLVKDRDSTERVTHPAELVYKDSAGASVKVAITLRTRGHFRRQARNCDFPPLKVDMAKEAAKNTLFEGNRTLKLASSCRPSNSDYEQYILQEAAVYRMYQALTPWSYRVRLARVTYQDSTGKAKPVTSWAFFVEDDGDLAQRRKVKKFETKGAYFDDLDAEQWGTTQLFQYLVGNTDWSVAGLHNITLLKDSLAIIHPVPFDFDWSGAVDARYAFPDKSLPIRTVRDRLWRGDCRPAELLTPTMTRFLERRPAMDSAFTTIEALSPAAKQRMTRYFADFWKLIENPTKAAAEFKQTCGDRN